VRLASALNRPGFLGAAWRATYEAGYALLCGFVLLLFRPLFGVHRLTPHPDLPPGGFLLCANHTSYLDPAFLQLVLRRRITFVMTNEFYERPAARWFFALVGAIPMSAGRLGHAGLRRAAAHVRRGHAVALFPEGRLSRDGRPGRPQRGVGYLARRTKAPVLTAGIRGAFQAWPRGARWLRTSSVRVLFGPVLRWEATLEDPRTQERRFAARVMGEIVRLAGFPDLPLAPGDLEPGPVEPVSRPRDIAR
jgi:1-acyl-sn-glycerol-3-phosphate acyltransferase